MRNRFHDLWVTSSLLLIPFSLAAEEGGGKEPDAYERCVQSRMIRSTTVINDRNIVFYMRGSKIYLNTLPAACRGLAREGRFSYVSHTSRLCKSDRINVINDSGFGIQQGRSCKLGQYMLVTKQDLAIMFDQRDEPVEARDPEESDVEDVVEGEAEPPAGEPGD